MLKISKCKKLNFTAPFLLFFSVFFVYLHNLSSSVFGGDVGDFISAISVKGVPHAPGYPLFTVLGIIANFLPGPTPAFKVGLISALFSAFSVCLVYFIVLKLTKKNLIAIITSLIVAFFYFFWVYAEIAEVFGLNTFFALLLFFLSICYCQAKDNKYFYLLALFAGLSLTNHQIIILTFPSILILLIAGNKKILKDWRLLLKGFGLFLLGFSVYLYIPIAASKNPPINWDEASNLQNFLRLILRKDYGTFSSTSTGVSLSASTFERFLEVKHYFLRLFINITPLGSALAFLGAIHLYKKKILIFAALICNFLIAGPIFTAYAGFPLIQYFNVGVTERFFIVSYVFVILFIPFGMIVLLNFIENLMKKVIKDFKMKKVYTLLFTCLFFILPLSLFRYNFDKTNLSNVWLGDDFAKDILYPLPKNSVLFLSGDTPIFNSWYVKYSLKERSDIEIININALGTNRFFLSAQNQFLKNHKDKKSSKELDMEVIRNIAASRPVFSLSKLSSKDIWLPYGLVFKYVPSKKDLPSKEDFLNQEKNIFSKLNIPYPEKILDVSYHNLTISVIPSFYSVAFANAGDFLVFNYNDLENSRSFFGEAIIVSPQDKYGYNGLGYIALNKGDCKNAEGMFKKVILTDPTDKSGMVLLYATYVGCFKDSAKAKQIATSFENKFRTPIDNQIEKYLSPARK